jgi:carboxypeptidase Q
MKKLYTVLACLGLALSSQAQLKDSIIIKRISDQILTNGSCYSDLKDLCKNIGHRLSGSPQAEQAVLWAEQTLRLAGADTVWLQPVEVPKWVRGEEQLLLPLGNKGAIIKVPVLSLGNAVGTNGKTMTGSIVMVNTLDELRQLPNSKVAGKIVFLNYNFKQDIVNTFEGYGDAGKNRWNGPSVASAKGASALIIRSISTGMNDVPHTGSTHYADSVKPIPAVAIGNFTANKLALRCADETVTAYLNTSCGMQGTVRSYNVIGELRGNQNPNQYIVAGAHLDSWDVGEGAHDDGAGCVLNIKPRNTLRVVLFMNEENGMKGGLAYADSALSRKEKHVIAIESDAGGFSPRGIGLVMSTMQRAKVKQWAPLFAPYGIYNFDEEEGGVDISPLKKQGVPLAGLLPDPQRYFDYHHTPADVFETVNHRELKLGAIGMAAFLYLIDEYGL